MASESHLFLRYSPPIWAKSPPEIFHCVMQAIQYMMAKQGFQNIIVYLDDFLAIGATQAECTQAYKVLLQLLEDLGFTISKGKLVPTMQSLPC